MGETVAFTGTINDINLGDTFSITWDFDDGGLSTNTLNPTHVFLNQGNYIVTLTVTDTAEFVVSDTLRVIVTQPPLYLPIIMKQASGAATLTAPTTDNLPFISPIPTPTPIPPSSMIDSLITDLDAACQQGQVDNQGVCHSLQGKLMKTQQYFNEDKIDKAVNELQAFVNEVAAQQDKHITVEVASRLITTAQQLLGQLQGQNQN